MNSQQTTGMSTSPLKDSIAEEAAHWLVTLRESTSREGNPYRDVTTRNAAFMTWIRRSAAHLLLFMEMVEVERRLERLDETTLAQIRTLLRSNCRENDQSSNPHGVEAGD